MQPFGKLRMKVEQNIKATETAPRQLPASARQHSDALIIVYDR
jgi:hypothetical protein